MKINKLNFKKGFTLIELLVVVAIIGILASIVMVSLNSGKSKTSDSKIQTQLTSVRTEANLLYAEYGTYKATGVVTPAAFPLGACANTANTFFSDSDLWLLINDSISTNGGTAANVSRCSQTTAGGDWAVAITLKNSDGATNLAGTSGLGIDSWCVDSGGRSKGYAWANGQTIANAITSNACN